MQVKNILKINSRRKLPFALLALSGVAVVVAPISIAASCGSPDIIVFNDFDIKQEAEKTKIVATETFDGVLPKGTVVATSTTPETTWTAVAPAATVISSLNSVKWTAVPKIPARWAGTFEKFEYLKGAYASASEAIEQTTWTSSLPTSFVATDRLWARPILRTNYVNPIEGDVKSYEFQISSVYDITTTSGLAALIVSNPALPSLPTTSYDLTATLAGTRTWASYILGEAGSATPKASVFNIGGGFYVDYTFNDPAVANRAYQNAVTTRNETVNGVTTTIRTARVPDVSAENILFRQLTLRVEYLIGTGDTFRDSNKATATGWVETLPSNLSVPVPTTPTAATWNKTTAATLVPTYYVYARVVGVAANTFTNNIIDLTAKLDLKAKVIALLPDAPTPAPTETPAV